MTHEANLGGTCNTGVTDYRVSHKCAFLFIRLIRIIFTSTTTTIIMEVLPDCKVPYKYSLTLI